MTQWGHRRALALASLLTQALLLGSCTDDVRARQTGPVPLHSTAEHAFVRSNGQPLVLNGMNVVPLWSGSPGQTWDRDHYLSIAARGFNSVRLVLHWSDIEPRRGVFDKPSLRTLDTAIANAKAAGLYVILDPIHLSEDKGMEWVPGWAVSGDSVTTVQTNAAAYLTLLAERYRYEPAVAAYDLVNEPHRWPIDQNAVLRMYDDLIATVRRVDPTKIVMVEPSYGDASIAAGCADLSTLSHRDNVVFSVHYYFAGGDDDGFGSDCWRAGRYASDGQTGYDKPDPIALRRHLDSYADVLAAQRIPLYIGEFGMGTNAANRDAWVTDVIGLFDQRQLGRAWWEYHTTANGGRFSATDQGGHWRAFVDKLVNPRIMAAGDFTACNGPEACSKSATAKVRDLITARNPEVILGIGDFQYQYIDKINNGFDLIFGPKPGGLWPKIRPTAGGYHDVRSCDGQRYKTYWERDPMAGYSFDIGAWHIISLPAAVYRNKCNPAAVLAWLNKDLDTNHQRCTLAFWQDPYWTRPTEHHDRMTAVRPWIDTLYAHGVDVVLQASNHNYQRFAPQDPNDRLDPIHGIRAFVVGTGGVSHYKFTGDAANVEASDDTTFGALIMTLHPYGYDWRFEPAWKEGFTDEGSGHCHDQPAGP